MGKRVILYLIIIQGLFFVAEQLFPDLLFDYLALQLWCSPDTCSGSLWMIPQLFTYSLLNDSENMFNFGANLYVLWVFGRHCEVFYGGWFVIVAYVASVVIAGVVHLALSYLLGQSMTAVGALGGALGLIYLFVLTFPWYLPKPIIPEERLKPARFMIPVFFAMTLITGWGTAADAKGILGLVVYFSPLGGLAGGYLCYRYREAIMLKLQPLSGNASAGGQNSISQTSP